MGVSQVHSVYLTFPYLSKNNMQLQFCYVIALRQYKHFFKEPVLSEWTNQLGVCCGHLKANASLCMDGGSGCGCC